MEDLIKKNHIIISTGEGFCTGCGVKLEKRLLNNEEKFDLKTGRKYKEYAYTCPKNFLVETHNEI